MDQFDQLPDEIRSQLRRHGSDLDLPHEFDFYLYFSSQAEAEVVAQVLSEIKFRCEVRGPIEGTQWLCLATREFVPTAEKLRIAADLFRQLEQDYAAEFDGWEAPVMEGDSNNAVDATRQ